MREITIDTLVAGRPYPKQNYFIANPLRPVGKADTAGRIGVGPDTEKTEEDSGAHPL